MVDADLLRIGARPGCKQDGRVHRSQSHLAFTSIAIIAQAHLSDAYTSFSCLQRQARKIGRDGRCVGKLGCLLQTLEQDGSHESRSDSPPQLSRGPHYTFFVHSSMHEQRILLARTRCSLSALCKNSTPPLKKCCTEIQNLSPSRLGMPK